MSVFRLFRIRPSVWIIFFVAFQILFDLYIISNTSRQAYYDAKVLSNYTKDKEREISEKRESTPTKRELPSKKPELPSKTKPVMQTKKPKVDMVNDYQPWIDFKFVYPDVQPVIDGPRDFYLVVLVNSGAKGDKFRQYRTKIRRTWANKTTCEQANFRNNTKIKDLKWILVFVLGKAGGEDDKRNIEEAKKHNDMLIGNIEDNYLNNILKYYMGQLWASLLGAKYTLKTDEDVYVRIPKVIEYLTSAGSPSNFYGGCTYRNSVVARWPGGKWSISKKYFAENVFPPFNAGAFILMSTDLLGSLINYVYIRKPFHTDDAYVGVAMRDLKVKVVNMLSVEISNDKKKPIRIQGNCDILKLAAYAHAVTPERLQHLHDNFQNLCRKRITFKNCS